MAQEGTGQAQRAEPLPGRRLRIFPAGAGALYLLIGRAAVPVAAKVRVYSVRTRRVRLQLVGVHDMNHTSTTDMYLGSQPKPSLEIHISVHRT